MATRAFGKNADTIIISVTEYNSLVETGRKYLSLRQALLAGGVTNESLDVLISNSSLPTPPKDLSPIDGPMSEPQSSDGRSRWAPTPTARPFIPEPRSTSSRERHQDLPRLQTALRPCNPSPRETASADGDDLEEEKMEEVQEDEEAYDGKNHVNRSLVITGLSPVTTLHSVAKVLRGGMILEMYIRYRDLSAHVSFVDPIAAENFLEYAQKYEIHIQGKKVTVNWDNQQKWIKLNLANRIAFSGQTRNLVIRFARENMTANSIREDLNHIHTLEIVDLFFNNGHAYISLNSIQNAQTARTCMYSQLKYKRVKIDCWPDDCAQPLPPPRAKQQLQASPVPTANIWFRNRFELLYPGTEESQEPMDLIEF